MLTSRPDGNHLVIGKKFSLANGALRRNISSNTPVNSVNLSFSYVNLKGEHKFKRIKYTCTCKYCAVKLFHVHESSYTWIHMSLTWILCDFHIKFSYHEFHMISSHEIRVKAQCQWISRELDNKLYLIKSSEMWIMLNDFTWEHRFLVLTGITFYNSFSIVERFALITDICDSFWNFSNYKIEQSL